jgi:four helix bundle protein
MTRALSESKFCVRVRLLQQTTVPCAARSKAEFVARIGVVVEEIDETVFWLELLVETGIVAQSRMESLQKEATELLAIFAASQHTPRSR